MKRLADANGADALSSLTPTDAAATTAYADPGFSADLIRWQKKHGRHALPWQNTRDAYRIWLSEIMLQQTQVAAVIPYYQRFLQRFPDVASLAAAPVEEVMAHWSGLGYYTRARNLHKCAKAVVLEFGGRFPDDPALLVELPGIGRSTAAAIAAFAYGTRAAILDGNVKRVFARVFGIEGFPGEKAIENQLWQRAVALLPRDDLESYTQGLMDLGATICTRSKPICSSCPMAARCAALRTDRVSELPARKPKKAIPERRTAMLLVIDHQQVLLEQRPAHGIWGGLLSLPEITDGGNERVFEEQVARAVASFGIVAHYAKLTPFSHTFTHFKLHIAPYRVELSRRQESAGQFEHRWVHADNIGDAPLPAPVKKLLLAVFNESAMLAQAA
jgi:A/G-specific adenine glycosylase